ncbi:MAG: prepilin-type N-terminal cleavage/methylation domain-containing protein [Candidatus Atribacteria bacterium]|nr:prepilin-type N-terminal cleavage/methylation domain-containing protein [Candidatus Atribacteria bacterium]
MLIKMSLRGTKQACPCVSRRSNLNGFTMIELMVAVAILAMAILGILQAYSVSFMGMADARDRTVATNYAQEKMEELINKPFEDITDEILTDISGTKFKREVDVDDEVAVELKKVTTEVNWLDRNGNSKNVVIETLIYNKDS